MELKTSLDTTPLCSSLSSILPIRVMEVCTTPWEKVWDHVVKEYHYLGYQKMFGPRLKYLIFTGERPIAAISFNQALFMVEARDCFIGWDQEQKKKYLNNIVNNNRFLIFPWINVKYLASHILSKVTRQLSHDWYNAFGYEVYLLETFVDQRFYKGICYKAANWYYAGHTKGYMKDGSVYKYHGNTKGVYLYPVKRNFREIIGCVERPNRTLELERERVKLKMMLQSNDWQPDLLKEAGLTEEEIPKLADELYNYCESFKKYMPFEAQRKQALAYLKGLMSNLDRKSIEPIALRYLDSKHPARRLQMFVKDSNWNDQGVLKSYQERLSETIGDPEAMTTVDSCDFPKKGKYSVGVARQHCGPLGKTDNCQSGVFVGYSSPKGYGLLNCRLYVPEKWFSDEYEELRKKCNIPEDLEFKTRIEIASELINGIAESGKFPSMWIGCDSFFGNNKAFLDSLPQGYYYFAEIHPNQFVWTTMPEMNIPEAQGNRGPKPTKSKPDRPPIKVEDIAKDETIPWETVVLGEGAKGPVIANVKVLRVVECRDSLPGKEVWLYIRKYADGTIKYSLSNAPVDIPVQKLHEVARMRWPIEQSFEEGKSYLGMDHYEARSWQAWHRHMLMVFLAQLFLLKIRLRFKKNSHTDIANGTNAFSHSNSCPV